MTTVREQFFEVARDLGMTRMFSNPGSTEVPLLKDLPSDFEFVLGLHEGSVVGMATGHAIGTGTPALVLLHTTAGFGNAVGALATARVNRAPLVVLVGQQDRRHLVSEPFLAGKLEGLAGDYPVWVGHPPRAEDVPTLVRRAYHEAAARRGPAVLVVPMDDWAIRAGSGRLGSPAVVRQAAAASLAEVNAVAQRLREARRPALVVGAGADDAVSWAALADLADGLNAPVWQEPFSARAGFPQDHRCFVGHLPPARRGVRDALAGHDLVLLVGAPSLRQYGFESGELFADGTTVVVVTDDQDEAGKSAADLAVVAPLPDFCRALAAASPRPRGGDPLVKRTWPGLDDPSGPLTPAEVFVELAARLPVESTVVEESPSSRDDLVDLLPARRPLGFLSAAMGGLGFAIPAAIGLRMARPHRPVVAVVGDGSSLYAIQSLWSAQHYGAGVLVVVLSNGGYAIMDRLAAQAGGSPVWPGFGDLRIADVAASFGCPSRRVSSREELRAALDEAVPRLGSTSSPLVLDVEVARAAVTRGAGHR